VNVYVAYHQPDDLALTALRVALEMDGIAATFVQTLAEDAYFNLWKELWDKGERFVLIEGDILPWPGAIQQVWDCPENWCGFPMYIHGFIQHSLGACPKFSAELLAQTKGAMDAARDLTAMGIYSPPTTWRGIDTRLMYVLMRSGLHGAHLHGPAVTHLNLGHKRKIGG
jgi:hypothetical protein